MVWFLLFHLVDPSTCGGVKVIHSWIMTLLSEKKNDNFMSSSSLSDNSLLWNHKHCLLCYKMAGSFQLPTSPNFSAMSSQLQNSSAINKSFEMPSGVHPVHFKNTWSSAKNSAYKQCDPNQSKYAPRVSVFVLSQVKYACCLKAIPLFEKETHSLKTFAPVFWAPVPDYSIIVWKVSWCC